MEKIEKNIWIHEITPDCNGPIPYNFTDKFIIRQKTNNSIIPSFYSKDIVGKILEIQSKSDGVMIYFISLDDSFKNKLSELCQALFDILKNRDCFIFLSGSFKILNKTFWHEIMTEMKDKYLVDCVRYRTWEKDEMSRGLVILVAEQSFSYFESVASVSLGFGNHVLGIKLKNGEIYLETQFPINFTDKITNNVLGEKMMTKLRKLFEENEQIVCIFGDFYDATKR